MVAGDSTCPVVTCSLSFLAGVCQIENMNKLFFNELNMVLLTNFFVHTFKSYMQESKTVQFKGGEVSQTQQQLTLPGIYTQPFLPWSYSLLF